MAILVATNLPLVLEGARSQLQALLLFSETAQTAGLRILLTSPNARAQLKPRSHPVRPQGAVAAEPTAGTSSMNRQLPTKSSLPERPVGPWFLAPWHSGPGPAATSQRKMVAFTAASLTGGGSSMATAWGSSLVPLHWGLTMACRQPLLLAAN